MIGAFDGVYATRSRSTGGGNTAFEAGARPWGGYECGEGPAPDRRFGAVDAKSGGDPAFRLVEVDAVSHSYGKGAGVCCALSGIGLTVERGSFLAVTGPSGSGKSTLLSLIAALETPTSGTVRLDGRTLADLTDADLADIRLRRLGLVFQAANLIPVLSVAENAELPLLFRREWTRSERRERVESVLARTAIWAKRHHRPAGLSVGERQRAALARALAGAPDLVVADEPTASLDPASADDIAALMATLNAEQSTTFVVATHDPAMIAAARETIVLRNGRVVGGSS